ncbi:MAG: aspartyl protease family protein [Candidatus Obscuribacterales bacterium]|nr:aspartyl protease family protein [Candidatus Obscuribacterales bacterium]
MRNKILALSVAFGFCISSMSAWGAAFEEGVKLFGQRNFKAAALKFDQAVKNNPNDSNAFYYRALNYQYLGDRAKASAAYQQIMQKFPYSTAAQYAQQALAQPEKPSRASRSSGTHDFQSSFGADPEQTKIHFTKQGKSLVVDAELNNRRIPVIFDTGAEDCVFGTNHLRQLGINPPTGPATGQAAGVGSAEPVKTWQMNVELKIGQIKRSNFPISVQENLPTEPLLGQSFFKDFEYTIDDSISTIELSKRGGGARASSGSDSNSVPFTQEGKELVVSVDVNGKKCQMYFDTGAEGITFTKEQARTLGLSIPEDAEQGTSMGIGGTTNSVSFTVQRMRMGPIEKSDIPVSVIEAGKMPKPLLGQTFYGGWQYTIDNQNKVIRFLRR